MPFPIRVCVVCHEEFELRPGKPGFANRCPACSEAEEDSSTSSTALDAGSSKNKGELAAERRKAMRDLLYRKDS